MFLKEVALLPPYTGERQDGVATVLLLVTPPSGTLHLSPTMTTTRAGGLASRDDDVRITGLLRLLLQRLRLPGLLDVCQLLDGACFMASPLVARVAGMAAEGDNIEAQ